MTRWSIVDERGQPHGSVVCETFGEAVEMAFPAKCCATGMDAVWLNAMTGPDERRVGIRAGGRTYHVYPTGREPLVDRLRRYAAMYEQAADDIDDANEGGEWAAHVFEQIASDYRNDADDLERIEADEMEGTPLR